MTNEQKNHLERLLRPEIRALKAYAVPDAQGLIKLDAMENPYSWPPALQRAWAETLSTVSLNRYPDPAARHLKPILRAALQLPAKAELLLGNGSDELIQIILLAMARPGAVVLAPEPSFVMYKMTAVFAGMSYVSVPLRADFSLDQPAMLAAIQHHRPAVVFLAYPNNPTGNLFSQADIQALIEATEGLVVVDEAYHAFAQTSVMGLLPRYDRLLVLRTLSKQGLAGLRLGMLVGHPAWLQEFDKVRLPYNIGSLTQASAEFALAQGAWMDEQARQIRTDREDLLAALQAIPGINAYPSQANFILFRVTNRPATPVHAALLKAGILIKNLDTGGTALQGCLRVTVGTPTENAAFLNALKQALA